MYMQEGVRSGDDDGPQLQEGGGRVATCRAKGDELHIYSLLRFFVVKLR